MKRGGWADRVLGAIAAAVVVILLMAFLWGMMAKPPPFGITSGFRWGP